MKHFTKVLSIILATIMVVNLMPISVVAEFSENIPTVTTEETPAETAEEILTELAEETPAEATDETPVDTTEDTSAILNDINPIIPDYSAFEQIMPLSLDIETEDDTLDLSIHVDDIIIGQSFNISWSKVSRVNHYEIAIVRISKNGTETYITSGTNNRANAYKSTSYNVSGSDVPADTLASASMLLLQVLNILVTGLKCSSPIL